MEGISRGSRFVATQLGLGTTSTVPQACGTCLRCSIPDASEVVHSLREHTHSARVLSAGIEPAFTP